MVEKAIVVLVMTFVIISGEIDLSVASVMGLSAVIVAVLSSEGVPTEAAIVVALRPAPCAASRTGSGSPSSASHPWR